MIAFGTFKKKSAFKLYAKSQNMDFALANEISAQIEKYEFALKNADDDDRDTISIYDFVEEKYWHYLDESSSYCGIISDKKKAPSAYLLYQGNIRREIGLIKCKSDSTKKECITCVIDGAIAESYKFLKNDILKVDSVLLISKVFERIGIDSFDVNTLLDLIKSDEKTWNVYGNGLTCGVNQVERESTKRRCMKYKPKNVSELSAFIAAIRPGFKSMYSKFEARENFSYGIDTLDNLLRTEELPVSYVIFQEQVMAVLNYAGFQLDECYGIIKAIAKKHPEKVRPLKSKFIEGFKNKLIEAEKMDETTADEKAQTVWQIVSDNCGYSFNCVSGKTKIIKSASNHHFNPTIEEMYLIKNDVDYAKKTGHKDLHNKYKTYGYGSALSLYEDDKLRPNRIVSIKPAGIRQTYEIKTKCGSSLVCTDNHKFPIENGYKMLCELKVGDRLFCKGEYKKLIFNYTLTDGNYEKNYPRKGQCEFQNKENGSYTIYDRNRKIHIDKCDSCEICGKTYGAEKRFELHHKDLNRRNNTEENFQWLCCSCHKIAHYKAGRTKRYENGIETFLDEIVSIEPKEVEQVYDVSMDDPYHTFVSESGLVTSNSSHAYCMALDSLYQAWQKANYPYEFYEVLLQHYSDKGDKDKVLELKKEMLEGFGIREGMFKFGDDNTKFVASPDNKCIYPALSSIKNISASVAKNLQKLGKDKSIKTFVDFLDKTTIDARQIDILIRLDYFRKFDHAAKLIKIVEMYNALKDKSQIKISKAEEIGIPMYLLDKHSEKITDKIAKGFDWRKLLDDWIEATEVSPRKKVELLADEFEFLGYVPTIINNVDKNIYVVLSISGSYNKTIELQQICTGNKMTIKCKQKRYEKDPISPGDFISVLETKYMNKWRKDENDQWEMIDEKENILTDYIIKRRRKNNEESICS